MNRLLSVESTYDGRKIKNESLEEANVSGYMRVGGLVGFDFDNIWAIAEKFFMYNILLDYCRTNYKIVKSDTHGKEV